MITTFSITQQATQQTDLAPYADMSDTLQQAQQELHDTANQLINLNMKLKARCRQLKELAKSIDEIRTYKDNTEIKKALYKLKGQIEYKLDDDLCWGAFQNHFDLVHSDFYKKLKNDYDQLSFADLELCAFLRMEMSNKEISNQLNISVRGVETRRYRLKKKLNLQRNQDIIDFLVSL